MSSSTNELLWQNQRKIMAACDGTPYAVYRLQPTTSNGILLQPPLLTTPARLLATTTRADTEQTLYELGVFDGVFGPAVLLGDVFVGEGGAYCFVEHRTCKPNICISVDRLATLSYPNSPATADDAVPPAQQNEYDDRYEGDDEEDADRTPVVLTNGVYSLGRIGAPAAQVPVGFMFEPRSPNENDEIPNAEPRETRIVYVIPTPGVLLGPGVVLDMGAGSGPTYDGVSDKYVVLQTFDEAPQNLVGTLLIVARQAIR